MQTSTNPTVYRPEIERRVLGAIFRTGALFDAARLFGVTEHSFGNHFHRTVFAVCELLHRDGGAVDAARVLAKLPGHGPALLEIEDSVATTVHFEAWCRDLKRAEAMRRVSDACGEYQRAMERETAAEPAAVFPPLGEALEEAAQMAEGKPPAADARELARRYAGHCLDAAGVVIPYFPPGTEGFAKIQHHRREIFVLGADTGCGKTALAVGGVCRQLEAGLRVVYFCTESPSEDIQARIAAQFCGISHHVPMAVGANQHHVKRFFEQMAALEQYDGRLFVRGCETGTSTPEGMRSELRRIISQHGPVDVMYVDYLQNMRTRQRFSKKLEAVDYCLDEIHAMVVDYNLAGFVHVQLNREGVKRAGLPVMSDIKDSSSIEQLAHTVSFLHRQEAGGQEVTMFLSRKTRNQPPFKMQLSWNGVGYVSRGRSGDLKRG